MASNTTQSSTFVLPFTMCVFKAVFVNGLKGHKDQKHETIPEVDGEDSIGRDTAE